MGTETATLPDVSSVSRRFLLRSAGLTAVFAALPRFAHSSIDEAASAVKGASLLPPAREGTAIMALRSGVLMSTGGTTGIEPVSACFMADPRSGIWYPVAQMRHRRAFHAMVALPNGKVLVMGGMTPDLSSTVEQYDPKTNEWTSLPPMRHATAYAQAALSGRTVTVTGKIPQLYSLDSNSGSSF